MDTTVVLVVDAVTCNTRPHGASINCAFCTPVPSSVVTAPALSAEALKMLVALAASGAPNGTRVGPLQFTSSANCIPSTNMLIRRGKNVGDGITVLAITQCLLLV